MTTESQQTTPAASDPMVKIERRVAHIESLVAWIFAIMVLGAIAGLIIGIVIAVKTGSAGTVYP